MNDSKNNENEKKENPKAMMGDVVFYEDNKKNEINVSGKLMGSMVQPPGMSWLAKLIKKITKEK